MTKASVKGETFFKARLKTARLVATAVLMGLAFSALTFWSVARSNGTVPEGGIHPANQRSVPLTGLVEIDRLRHLDAGWYLDIAQNGYRLDAGQSNVVFFPLLPALIRGAAAVTGWSLGFAGQAVSWSFMLGTCALLAIYARSLLTPAEAGSEVWTRALALSAPAVLLMHPMGVFLHAVYPESLFICLCTAFLLVIRQQRIALAAGLCFAMALSRPQGMFVPLALVGVDLWSSVKARRLRTSKMTLACTAAVVLATLLFAAYLGQVTGEPWSFWTKRAAWDAEASVLHIPAMLAPIITRQHLLAKLTLYVVLFGAWMLWRRGERVGALLCLLFVVLPLQKGNLGDSMRYSLLAIYAVIPLLFYASRLPLLIFGSIGASACLHGFFLLRFLQGVWVG